MEGKERYEWDKLKGIEWIRDTEKASQPLYYDLKTVAHILNQQDKRIKELEKDNQQLKQAQNKKAIEELEGLQVQCQFSITFADYKQEQRLYDYINDRIKELKGVDVNA